MKLSPVFDYEKRCLGVLLGDFILVACDPIDVKRNCEEES